MKNMNISEKVKQWHKGYLMSIDPKQRESERGELDLILWVLNFARDYMLRHEDVTYEQLEATSPYHKHLPKACICESESFSLMADGSIKCNRCGLKLGYKWARDEDNRND